MTEFIDRITPEMSEEEVLGVILDEIMARAEPDVAEAIRFCVIPHWFNEEIIAWLRGEGLSPSQRSREILASLTELTFVGLYHEQGWAYHENVRDLLLRWWRERDGEEFKELSGRAADYFGQKAEVVTDEERDEWKRERMYHLLVADEEQGHELFQSMFDGAIKFYRLSTCSLLLQLAGEFREYLSKEHQQCLRYNEGQLAHRATRWGEALEFFEALLEEELVDELRGEVLGEAGMVYKAKGEWERAIEYYERSLTILEKVGDEHSMASVFNNLGVLYRAKGEWGRAIECFEHSLAIRENMSDESRLAAILNNLGVVHQARGEWEQAIEYFERSLAITQKIGDNYTVARTFNNLGSVYRAKGEWERASECYEWSLALGEKVSDEHGKAFSYRNIARLYQEQGRLEESILLFEKSLEILERIGDKPNTDIVRENLEKAKRELEAKTGQG